MKTFIISFSLILLCSNMIAQTFVNYSPISNAYGSLGAIDASLNNNSGIEGSPLLFNDWSNSASLYAGNEKKVDIKNINFNTQNSTFISRISKDTIFTFHDIDKVYINDRVFILINNKFYENLAPFNSGYLLKAYNLKVIPQKHRITNTIIGPGKYKIENEYFLVNNGKLSKIKLRKKDILQHLYLNKDKVTKYVKNHNLSFSREKDIIKIFDFFENLKG